MDEILNRWASELSTHTTAFKKQAEQVAEWDRALVENTDKIGKLYLKTFQAERDAAEVERQLSAVEAQQAEMETLLDGWEREVESIVQQRGGEIGGGGGVDAERERTYQVAEKVSERLTGLNKDLADVVEEINNASAMLNKSSNPDDPVSAAMLPFPVTAKVLVT